MTKGFEGALFENEGGLYGMYQKGKKKKADRLFDDAVETGQVVRLF